MSKKKKTNKVLKHLNRAHSRQRAHERYDLNLKDKDFKKIARLIVENKASFKSRKGDCSVWVVNHKGKYLKVVYNEALRNIQTILPITEPEFGPDPDNPFADLLDIRKDLPPKKPKNRGRK
jgi:hypothetical protein